VNTYTANTAAAAAENTNAVVKDG
jgi:hypothetical protein